MERESGIIHSLVIMEWLGEAMKFHVQDTLETKQMNYRFTSRWIGRQGAGAK
jgi:hypothetical protein